MSEGLHTNRLAGETSPYLLQHAHNPVDWYPWGDEAFERARREDRPLLLSVGYAACHWCHVMERESFENPEIARLMNANFVCVKVDREERPDVDEIYMSVVQAMTGHGGWPMTVFLTPDGKPFYGGTYYPPVDRHGMPGFPTVLQALSSAYRDKKDDVVRNAEGWTRQLNHATHVPKTGGRALVSWGLIDKAVDKMSSHFDEVNGGFGGPPKFPHSMDLSLFMRTYRRTGRLELMSQVRRSLARMASGGIYDQVGGGFHRYSVDERWMVPHFEKMLYDNALLARTYLEAYQVTGEPDYARVARETLDYVLLEMRDPAGGFWSSQDADSEGEEGKFFVWDPDEVKAVLGPMEAEVFCACHGIEEGGNFEHGKTVVHRAMTASEYAEAGGLTVEAVVGILAQSRAKLYEARSKRVHPGTDDKVLSSWNGLMIGALADGYRILGDPRYLDAARAAAAFASETMTTPEGRLLRTYRAGQAKLAAYLEDYGAMACAMIDLYEASFETRWLQKARELVSVLIEQFWDEKEGGFHFTGKDGEKLLVRTKPYQDGATPSGNSLAVTALVRLSRLTGDEELVAKADQTFALFADVMEAAPSAFAYLLGALDFHLSPPVEVAIVGPAADPATRSLADAARRLFLSGRVLAHLPSEADAEAVKLVPMLEGKKLVAGKPAAYVCKRRSCSAPVTTPEALEAELARD